MVYWSHRNEMKRIIEVSGDGSTTFRVKEWDEPYHSRHGAIQESQHVFIEQGLRHLDKNPVRILEMGLGTGLNALLTYLFAHKHGLTIEYLGVEAYPLQKEEWTQLNYLEQLNALEAQEFWSSLHTTPMDSWIEISESFRFKKNQCDFRDVDDDAQFDLIYFDAFGPRVQPELWTTDMFEKMIRLMKPGGHLVTYCAKGDVRRSMMQVGFRVERIPGPPGKREMLRASK